MFRAGQIEQAETMAWKFINAADPAQTLHDMQCMWYQIECGAAHLQKKNFGRVSLASLSLRSFKSLLHDGKPNDTTAFVLSRVAFLL